MGWSDDFRKRDALIRQQEANRRAREKRENEAPRPEDWEAHNRAATAAVEPPPGAVEREAWWRRMNQGSTSDL
jgi:hypothetical protein